MNNISLVDWVKAESSLTCFLFYLHLNFSVLSQLILSVFADFSKQFGLKKEHGSPFLSIDLKMPSHASQISPMHQYHTENSVTLVILVQAILA